MAWKRKDGTRCEISQGERWFLLYNYLMRNTGKGRTASRKQIMDYLDSMNASITPHTLYTDFETLRGPIFGLEIETDKRAHRGAGGYWVKNPPFEPYELRLMVDSIQASKFITQTAANQITKKIKRLASVPLDRPAAVANRVRSMNESIVKEADRIFEAITSNSKISFRYFHRTPSKDSPKKYTKDGAQTIVSPFSMLWDGGNYYLYAYDGKRFRTYRIDRMDRIFCLADKREGVEQFNAKELTRQKATVFEMFHGQEYTIKFRCHNSIADAVIDKFGDAVMLIPDDETHFTFTAAVEVSPPFYAWVSTFGRRIRIVSPAAAIDGLKVHLQKALGMYEDEER